MSLRLTSNLIGNRPVISPVSSSGWTSPVEAMGTGTTQAIELPEAGLGVTDVMLFVNGIYQPSGYHISTNFLVTAASQGSTVSVVRVGVGTKGDKGDPGPKGEKGDKGDPYVIMGVLPSVIDLPAGGPETQGWIVGGHLWTWDGDEWNDMGDILSSGDGGYNYDMDGGEY